MDIATYGVADYLNVLLDIEDDQCGTHFQAGNTTNPEKVIYLRRSRPDGLEHYQLIESSGNIRNVMADGNCLFRAVAAGYYGNEQAWQDLRQQTANYINNNWEHYAAFVPKGDSVALKGETELPQKNPLENISLSSQYPILSEMILNHIAMALRRDLEACFDLSLSSGEKDMQKKRDRVSNAFSHFISCKSAKKISVVEEYINSWEISSLVKKDMINRLHDLSKNIDNLHIRTTLVPCARANEGDFDKWGVLFDAANQELAYVLWKAGPTQKQLSCYLALSEAATLVQAIHKRPVMLMNLLSAPGYYPLNLSFRKIRNSLVAEMINGMVYNFREVAGKIWQKIYQYNNMLSHLIHGDILGMRSEFYYTADFEYVAYQTREDIDEIIKERAKRLMIERYYKRVPIMTLYHNTIDNSPLVLNRSDINADTRKLIKLEDGEIREDVIKSILSANRGNRIKILFDNMFIAPLVVGDGFQITSVDLQGLPFGIRGLSIEEIDRLLIDNAEISDGQLRAIAIYSNRLLREITTTGELFPSVKWLLSFDGDTLLSFFVKYKNLPEDLGYAYFLVDKLQIIAQKLYGHKSFGEDIITLLENSLEFCHGEITTIDELAYLLTSPSNNKLRIISIADRINTGISDPENANEHYKAWRKFVISSIRDENSRGSLDERQQLHQQAATT
ncbi:hypothetical protein CUN67_03820 [Pantoea cypripedii]|uniref:OTU domain-containing protein n=2 Tax=Pantoea cypripedii TaxID=55209 RepID=A0A6B9FZL6_PANCY|nr:hypothetical protein CUN67_03820 [Pantoea cypripedii]